MAGKDYYTNIMLDLECASVFSYKPVIIELAAVHFDIETGTEFGRISRIINFKSCVECGLDSDPGEPGDTKDWLQRNIPETLASSEVSRVSLHQALRELTTFVKSSCEATRKRVKIHPPPREYSQPAIWGNGENADNVWIHSAYKACSLERPWKYFSDRCVRTFVKQCLSMTGRDFSREVVQEGVKHRALDDCRHQIKYLVKARNELMPRTRVERMLPSPETSFSSMDGDVGKVFTGSSLPTQAPSMKDPRNLHEAPQSSVAAEIRASSSNYIPTCSGTPSGIDGQNILANESTQKPGLTIERDQRRRNFKVAKPESPQGNGWTSFGGQRRRNVPVKAPKQLATPETSFSAEEYEKEYELGRQLDDKRFFGS